MLNEKSRVKGDFQARFRENAGVKFPCVTRLAVSARKTYRHGNFMDLVNLVSLFYPLVYKKKTI